MYILKMVKQSEFTKYERSSHFVVMSKRGERERDGERDEREREREREKRER